MGIVRVKEFEEEFEKEEIEIYALLRKVPNGAAFTRRIVSGLLPIRRLP